MDVRRMDQEPSNRLIKNYLKQDTELLSFFDHSFHDQSSFRERAEALHLRSFQRDALAETLTVFNERYTDHPKVFENINKLKDPQSVAVVGGQQAGLLTGPAFSVHKCISIIKLAREQEHALGIPVVPVFWIAGEDHDLDEVNHVFVEDQGRLKKKVYENLPANKRPVSELPIDHELMEEWVEQVFHHYGETEFSSKILDSIKEKLKQSSTYVDFFAALILYLFEKEGLVLLDSASEAIREVEVPYFEKIIDQNGPINEAVMGTLEELNQRDYSVNLDQPGNLTNLFYDDGTGRVLLEREGDGFIHPSTGETFSKDKIGQAARENKLSNNVVTRPIMQDLLLPVLAFVAGPGEIAYWSALKKAFHVMDISMPVIIPRLHFTLMNRQTIKWLKEKSIDPADLFLESFEKIKERWLNAQHDFPVASTVEKFKTQLEENHLPLLNLMEEIDTGHRSFAEKNLLILLDHVNRFEKKANQLIESRYEIELRRFDHIEKTVQPMNGPQERKWTIFYFINQYGMELIEHLLEADVEFNGKQHLIMM